MKWFQNDSDAPDDPKVKPILRRGLRNPTPGQAAAGAMWLLWCFVANHGDGLPGEGINSERQPLDLQEMADECFFDSVDDLRAFLDLCAEKRLVNPDRWKNEGVVFLPGMYKRADAYARSKGRTLPGAAPVQDGEPKARPGKRGQKRANVGKKSPGREQTAPELPLQDSTNNTVQTEQKIVSSAGADGRRPTAEDLVAVYNQHRTKGPKVSEVTPDRRRKYDAALKLQPDLTKWAAAVTYADGQRWCNAPGTGDNPNYRLHLDSLVRPGSLVRMLERIEADRTSTGRGGGGGGGAGGSNGRVAPTAGKYAGGDDDGGGDDGGEAAPGEARTEL